MTDITKMRIEEYSVIKREKTNNTGIKSTSGTSINDLDDDLLDEILHRLPFKSAVQCKCVSKRWFSLISSPCFVSHVVKPKIPYQSRTWSFLYSLKEEFFTNEKKNPCFTNLKEPVFNSPGFSLSFLPCYRANERCPIYIVGTSKGLILCCESEFNQRVYYICNPLTKHWVALPPAPECHEKVHVGFVCNVYSRGQVQDGIAFNVESKFKVVRIYKPENSNSQLELEIFSSGKWIKRVYNYPPPLSTPPPPPPHWPDMDIVVCERMFYVHWVIPNKLIAFHFNKSHAGFHSYLVDLPKYNLNICHYFRVFRCGGPLCLCSFVINYREDWKLRVWKRKGDEWILAYLIYLGKILDQFDWENFLGNGLDVEYVCRPVILGFHPIDENIVYFTLHPYGMFSYNMKTRILEFVEGIPGPQMFKQSPIPLLLSLWPWPVPKL